MQRETSELCRKLQSVNFLDDKLCKIVLLQSAVRAGDETGIQELLEQEPQLNSAERSRLLWDALLRDQIGIATMLLDAGDIDFNIRKPGDKLHSTFLHEFTKSNDERYDQLAVLMMKHGVDVNARDRCFLRPLHYAIRSKSTIYVIRELLKHGARVESSFVVDAADHPDAAELTILLVGGFVDCRTRNQRVDDALFYCAYAKTDESKVLPAVKLLLGMNVPVEELLMGRRTLLLAIHTQKVEMVRLLIKYGIEVNGSARRSESPLFSVPGCENWYDYISWGELPLFAASTLKQSVITEILIRAGAEVNARFENSKGCAIYGACKIESLENIRVLLRYGADIRVTTDRGLTPLSVIKFSGQISVAHQMIIKHLVFLRFRGKSVNTSDLEYIQSHFEMHAYFTECLDELEKMKVIKIMNGTSFVSIFENVREISFLTRNSGFLECYNKVQRTGEFPIYSEELDFALANAKTRRNLLIEKEEAICESLESILPYVPLEKVIYYFYLYEID